MKDRYKYSVLDVCQQINGYCKGSYVPGWGNDKLLELYWWLRWRLEDGWLPTPKGHDFEKAYDDVVRMLGLTAVVVASAYLDKQIGEA